MRHVRLTTCEQAALRRQQGAEAGQANTATADAAAAVAALRTGYVRHRKLARTRHPRGTAGHSALHLTGDTPDAEDAVVGETDAFYASLTADPTLYAGVRGLNKAAVTAGVARVDAARAAQTAQGREDGEAQEATVRRQTTEASLRVLAADVAAAVEDAFHDQPQRRERLGLFARGPGRR